VSILEAQEIIDTTGWTVEAALGYNGRLSICPDPCYARPYAVLDYLWFVDHPGLMDELGKFQPQKYKDFTQRQKQLIYLVNRLRNNGWLKSDYTGDSQSPLPCDVGGRTAAQVDHVLPENSGGLNLFSNARVCTGKFNNKVRTKSPEQKMDYVLA
jgi:5-methylcytosine-specific restriction endonuclease McrA